MKIIKKEDSLHIEKPEGLDVCYYLRPEYEVHYNVQAPRTSQIWHHHEKVWETLFIIEGELLAKWRENGKTREQLVKAGDLIESGATPHTFFNNSGQEVKFLVIKQILDGNSKKGILRDDKVLD